jgi:triacylglycerol esterase/lipase EstA (alpha/beta hydrolase family)
MRSLVVLCAAVSLCTVFGFGGAAAESLGPDGAVPNGSSPPHGANDWHCAPTAAHPDPVVLVHGTWGNQNNWDVLAPKLKSQGYCVFTLNYGRDAGSALGAEPGIYGTGDIRASARELGAFVEKVLAATTSEHVDLVAHSQGGIVARQYMRFDGGVDHADPRRNTVRRLVMIGATNHGTTFKDVGFLDSTGSASGPVAGGVARVLGVAAAQQVVGSRFLAHLNADGDTEPGVDYTVIASRVDDVTTPPESTFLRPGPRAVVDNVWVQAVCASDTAEHAELPRSPTVIRIVQRALDPAYSAGACGD